MSTLLTKLQKRQKSFKTSEQTYSANFIANGYPSITITSGDNEVSASVVSKQEQDEAYIYTDVNTTLDIGSVWSAKGLSWIVSEEIVTIKDVDWHKYYCYLCNAEVNEVACYFYGPGKSKISVNLQHNTFLLSSQSPVLVVPDGYFSYGDKIKIGGRAWLIQEYDNITDPGISYCTLVETTMSKGTVYEAASSNNPYSNIDGSEDAEEIELGERLETDPTYVLPGKEITLELVNGKYSTSNPKAIKIIKRTGTSLVFTINHNVDLIEITTGEETYKYTTLR